MQIMRKRTMQIEKKIAQPKLFSTDDCSGADVRSPLPKSVILRSDLLRLVWIRHRLAWIRHHLAWIRHHLAWIRHHLAWIRYRHASVFRILRHLGGFQSEGELH
jgi:hypothetical protein